MGLFILTNLPGATFIQEATSIPDSRVAIAILICHVSNFHLSAENLRHLIRYETEFGQNRGRHIIDHSYGNQANLVYISLGTYQDLY